MRRERILFENCYYTCSPRARRGYMTTVSRTGRARLRALGPTAGALLTLAVLLLVPLGASGAAPTVSHGYASYDTGRVHISLPGAEPSVSMTDDANSAISALLSTTAVVELAPTGSSYDVLATALPTPQTAFNGSRSASATAPWALSLSADLAVRSTSGTLWNSTSSGPTPAAGASFGVAELRVDFTPGPTTSSGASLLVTWAVANWPLAAPNDYLGVEFDLETANAPIVEACQDTTALAAPACSGAALGARTGVWSPATTGVEADNGAGAVAALGWSPSVTNGSAAPAVAGARADPSGGIDVVVAEPASPSASTGTLAFALYSPVSLPSTLPQVSGDGPYYLIAASLAAGGTLGALALARGRDEAIEREL
jgi:hypothetical protein